MTSFALWIPLIWVIIIGTRDVSIWFSSGEQFQNLDDYLAGNPLDRNIFFGLLIAGLAVLIKRMSHLLVLAKKNSLFLMFFILCGISCCWSDYAETAFKRYMKDFGNVVMAFIIITEANPKQALRAVLARYAYLAITLSVLFIIYFPELGRYYNRWTYTPVYCGISTEKNTLGQFAFICGLFILWDLIETLTKKNHVADHLDSLTRFILLAWVIWLLYMAQSSTSIFCMIFGSIILIFMRTSVFKNQIKYLGIWTIALFLCMIIINLVPGLLGAFVEILGRDSTLTGRTDLWKELLDQPINPLLGSGFQSFWQTPAAARLGEKYYFIPNQAHNGYLEVYIQTGLISLFLLIATIFAAGKKIKRGLLMGDSVAKLFSPFFLVILINNWTEASFNKISLIWFIMILLLLYIPRRFKNDAGSINDGRQNI